MTILSKDTKKKGKRERGPVSTRDKTDALGLHSKQNAMRTDKDDGQGRGPEKLRHEGDDAQGGPSGHGTLFVDIK